VEAVNSLAAVGNIARRLRQSLRWLTGPRTQHVPRSWLHCPICDSELVGPYPSGSVIARSPGPSVIEPGREELIAKCPVHDHRPYNDPDRHPPFRQVSE
jgi:hypothetical protein